MRAERLREIELFMKKNGSATLKQLCSRFNVSLNTIRRDVKELVESGKVSKVYGGIVCNDEDEVIPFSSRSNILVDEKKHIGSLAASLIEDGDTIYIDSGTTAVNILPFAAVHKYLTIISNSLTVFNEVQKYPNLVLISPGGMFAHKTKSFSGISALSSLQNIRIKKAFMGATKVSIDEGATNNSFHEAEIKRAAIKNSRQIILMADNGKLDQSAAICFCELSRLSHFVTDKRPPDKYIDFFKEKDIKVLF